MAEEDSELELATIVPTTMAGVLALLAGACGSGSSKKAPCLNACPTVGAWVAPESRPLEKVMGPQLGDVIRALHEHKGEVMNFHFTPIGTQSWTLPRR